MHDFLDASDWARLSRIEKQLGEQKGLLVSLERSARQQKPGRTVRRSDPGMTLVKMACAYVRDEGAEAIEAIRRSAAAPADTVTPGWASELSQSTVAGFILSIAGQSAYASIASRSSPLNFGRAGQQAITYGGNASAGFVAEGDMIGVTAATLGKMTVKPAKVTAIASFSSELAKSGNFETVLRKLLRDAVSGALDAVFFSDDAGTPASPAGVLNGVTATPPSSKIDLERAMIEDLANLVKALDGPADPSFIVAPDRRLTAAASLGPQFDYPLFASSAIPADRVVCVDAAALVAAHDSTPEFLTSTEAIAEEDQAGVASPLMSGAPVRSYFQTDTRGLLISLGCAWRTRPGGASFTEGVAW